MGQRVRKKRMKEKKEGVEKRQKVSALPYLLRMSQETRRPLWTRWVTICTEEAGQHIQSDLLFKKALNYSNDPKFVVFLLLTHNWLLKDSNSIIANVNIVFLTDCVVLISWLINMSTRFNDRSPGKQPYSRAASEQLTAGHITLSSGELRELYFSSIMFQKLYSGY